MQKIPRFDAAIDHDDEGGVCLLDENNHEALNVRYEAIEPEVIKTDYENNVNALGPYPPLPSKKLSEVDSEASELVSLASKLGLSSDGDSESVTSERTARADSTISSPRKAWENGEGSKALFPHPTSSVTGSTAPSEFSVEQHDHQMESVEGINLLNTRFWDPASRDWNPERFYDTVTQRYYCPFVCE
jgi:hypothetical protein